MHDVILFLMGIIVGGMNAIAGGGMLLGFPVLIAVGISPIVANATSSVITLPGQISSAYGYRAYLARTPRRYLVLILPCLLGGAIGATLLRHTSPTRFRELVPILILFAVFLFAFQPFLHNKLHKHLHGPKHYRNKLLPLLLICLAMFPTAVYGGYFGAGFGFIMLAFLGFTKLHQAHQINAMKNLMAIGLVSGSIACLYSAHLIDWGHGAIMGAGGLLGGYVGARSAQKVPGHALRVVIIIIGLSTTVYLGLRSY
jgi:uncharacterized protein